MLLLSSKKYILTSFIVTLSTVFLGFVSININELDSVNFSIDSQNILFWGIVVFIIQLFVIVNLYRSHQKIVTDIRRIAKIGELSNPNVQNIISKLGPLGLELEVLIKSQNELVELRANRITSLNSLVSKLCIDSDKSILISDVNGKILHISNVLKHKIDDDEILKQKEVHDIYDIVPNILLDSVISHMELQKSFWVDEENKGLTAYPIFGKDNNLSFCLWEFDSSIKKISKGADVLKSRSASFNNFLDRFKKKKNI